MGQLTLGHKLLIYLGPAFLLSFRVGTGLAGPPDSVQALIIYACDADDNYDFPAKACRDSLYARMTDYFSKMSYGKHWVAFREAHSEEKYFRSQHKSSYYKKHYNRTRHERGFAYFNEEILSMVKARYGEDYFKNVDMIIIFGTDAGPNWYHPRFNATGFGMLGVDFKAGGKTFGRRQAQGGFTLELGSDHGTPDPHDDALYQVADVDFTLAHEYGHWLGLQHRPPKLGAYSLMTPARYPDIAKGLGPQPLDPFNLIELGWLDDSDSSRVMVSDWPDLPLHVELSEIRSKVGKVLLHLQLAPSQRMALYFSYHSKGDNAYDAVLPTGGLVVWEKRGSSVGRLKTFEHDLADMKTHTEALKFKGFSLMVEFRTLASDKISLAIASQRAE